MGAADVADPVAGGSAAAADPREVVGREQLVVGATDVTGTTTCGSAIVGPKKCHEGVASGRWELPMPLASCRRICRRGLCGGWIRRPRPHEVVGKKQLKEEASGRRELPTPLTLQRTDLPPPRHHPTMSQQ